MPVVVRAWEKRSTFRIFGINEGLLQNNPSRANLYLRMQNKERHTAWPLCMIEKAKEGK